MTKIRSITSHYLDVDGIELGLTHKPDGYGDTTIVKRDGKIIVGYLVQDGDCPNPLEDDGVGDIRSLNRRHTNHISEDEARQILEDDKDAVALSYFEHGLCKWGVTGTMRDMPDFSWDGVNFAGIWIPDDSVRESYTGQGGKTREQWMMDQAASACEQYTSWSNGDCWGVCVDTFDAETGKKLEDDAIWGFVGSEWAEQELKSQLNP